MPFTMKFTTIFSGVDTGWTETYYYSALTDSLQTARDFVYPIVEKRAKLLGAEAYVKAVRMSVELNEDGSKRKGDSLLTKTFLQGTQAHPCSQKDLSLQVLFTSAQATRRKLTFLGGIWDEISVTGGAYNPGVGAWASYFNSWRGEMLTRGMGWIGSQPIAQGTITGYTSTASSIVTLTCAAPGPFGAGPYSKERVRIAGLNGKSVLNGQQLVIANSATECVITKPIAAGAFVSPGTLTRSVNQLIIAADLQAQNIMSRERGRPLLTSPGRRAARARV